MSVIPEILSHYFPIGYAPGDVIECGIKRIDVLRNHIVSWAEAQAGAALMGVARGPGN